MQLCPFLCDNMYITQLDGKFYQATTDENGNKVAVTDDEGKKIEATGLNNVKILNIQHGANVT